MQLCLGVVAYVCRSLRARLRTSTRIEPFGLGFIVFRFARNSFFHVAFSILYFQSLGFSLSTALSLESFYYIAKALFEVPSGVLADRHGRKHALVLGSLIAAMSYLGMGLCDRYWQMVVFEIGLGLSMSLTSGTDSALLHEEYLSIGKTHEYESVESLGWGMRNIARGLASAIGAFFAASYTMASTFILTSIAILLSAPIAALFLKERTRGTPTITEILSSAHRLIRTNSGYRRILFQFAMMTIGVKVGFWAFQPFATLHHVPLEWLGVCFTALLAVSLVSSLFISQISRPFGHVNAQTILVGLAFGTLALSFLVGGWGGMVLFGAGLLLHGIAQGISDPIMRILINRSAESESRTTAMSIASMAGDGAFSAIAPLFGYLVEHNGGSIASLAIMMLTLTAFIPELFFHSQTKKPMQSFFGCWRQSSYRTPPADQ